MMNFNNGSYFGNENSHWPFPTPCRQGDQLSSYSSLSPQVQADTRPTLQYQRSNGAVPRGGGTVAPSLTDINNVIKPNSSEPWSGFGHQNKSGVAQATGLSFPSYSAISISPASAIVPSSLSPVNHQNRAVSDSGYHSSNLTNADNKYQLPVAPSASTTTRGRARKSSSATSQTRSSGRVTKQSSKSIKPIPLGSEQRICRLKKPGKSGAECGKVLKNKSEEKKHKLAHERPYACELEGCKNVDKRFGTKNDLDRHLVGVHRVASMFQNKRGGYICAGCSQEDTLDSQGKWWPRKDNFKSHWDRKHKNTWPLQKLLDESYRDRKPTDVISESGRGSVSHVDHEEAQHMEVDLYQASNSSSVAPNSGGHLPFSGARVPFPPPAGTNGDYLAGVGAGPGAEAFGNTNFGFEHMFESELSTLDNPEQAETSESYNSQYGTTQFRTPTAGGMMNESPQHEPRWNFPSGQHSTMQHPQVSFGGSILSRQTTNDHSITSVRQPSVGTWMCEHCGKSTTRECDLRKHRKRHTRPYGCTFPYCGRRLGSRNDWKRHENKQHFLNEMWRCMHSRPDGGTCGKVFHDLNGFVKHLADRHGRSDLVSSDADAASDPDVREMHLGRQGHEHFWCGFCNALIKSTAREDEDDDSGLSLGAWELRFQHIGDHFDKDGRDIGDWICIERNQPLRLFPSDHTPTASMASSRRNSHKGRGASGTGVPNANISFQHKSEEDSDLGDDGIPDDDDMPDGFGDDGLFEDDERSFNETWPI